MHVESMNVVNRGWDRRFLVFGCGHIILGLSSWNNMWIENIIKSCKRKMGSSTNSRVFILIKFE